MSQTSLGSLLLELRLDTKTFNLQMQQAQKMAASYGESIERSLHLKPTVDHTELYELNKHLDLKKKHFQEVNKYFQKNRLKPQVDFSDFKVLNQTLNRYKKEQKISIKAKFHVDDSDINKYADKVGDAVAKSVNKKVSESTPRIRTQESRTASGSQSNDSQLADKIGNAVAKNVNKGTAVRAVGNAASMPLKLAGNAAGKLGESLLFGVSQEITKSFGKGISKSIETAIGRNLGSTELVGEKLGEVLSNAIAKQLGAKLPGTLQDEVANALKDILGAENIARESMFQAGTRRKDQTRKAPLAREQATEDRRSLLRQRMEAQSRVSNVSSLIANNERETQKGEELRARIQQQALREQMLGASPKRLAMFDNTLSSLNKQLNALGEEARDLAEVLVESQKELDSFDAKIEANKKTLEAVTPEALPKGYRDALQQMMGGRKISENRIPKLVVADEKLRQQNARAVYGVESNTLQITSELDSALRAGKLTIEQMEDLFHELQHAIDFDFGSAEGIQARREGRILGTPQKATVEEMRQIAPLINQYSPEERGFEINAEISGRRNAKKRADEIRRQQAINNLYQSGGFGGQNLQAAASKQIEATANQLQVIRNIAKNLGINIESELSEITEAFRDVSQNIEVLSNQSLSLDDLDVDQIEGLESQFREQFEQLETIQDVVSGFRTQFMQRGRSVQQGQQIKAQLKQQLDSVNTVLSEVSKKSFQLNIAVGKRYGELQENSESLSQRIEESYQSILQQPDLSSRDIAAAFSDSVSQITQLKEAANKYQDQFEKRVSATRLGRGVRDVAQGVGNAAVATGRGIANVVQSPQFQAFTKGTQQAAGAMVQVAKVGYNVASGLESVALDLIPMGRTIKAISQQTVVPAALAMGATAMLPGGAAMAGTATHLVGGAIAPFAQSATAGMTGAATSALSGLPHLMGIQATVTGAITGAIEAGMSGVTAAVTPAIAAVLGGKVLQTAASMPVKGLVAATKPQVKGLPAAKENLKQIAASPELQQQPLQMPLKLPSAERVEEMAIELRQKPELKKMTVDAKPSQALQQAKNAAQKAGETTRQAVELAQKAGQTTKQVVEATQKTMESIGDAVQQADKISKAFWNSYKLIQDAISSGDAEKAQWLLNNIKQNAEQAKKDITGIARGLGDQAKMGTAQGNQLNNRKSQISRAVKQAESQVRKMKPGDTPNDAIEITAARELESSRLKISQDQIADAGINLAGLIGSQLGVQHGIVGELAGDLIGALVARMGYQVGKTGVKAFKGAKSDPTFEAANALEKFARIVEQINKELQSEDFQKEMGNALTGDLAGFGIGNASAMAMNAVDSLSGIPFKGAGVAMATVPQIQKMRQQIADMLSKSTGMEDESARLELGKLQGGAGLSEDAINRLRELNELLTHAESAADMMDAAFRRIEKSSSEAFNNSQQGLDDAIASFENGVEPINQVENGLGRLGKVGRVALVAFTAFQAVSFLAPMLGQITTASLQAAKEFENLDRIFAFAYGSMNAGASAMAKVRSEAKALGIDLRSALQGQAQLAASTRGTAMEGFTTEALGTATREATAVMGLDPQQAERVQLAIQQMASKGKISAEELRQQLSESLPGAFQIAARSIGVTTSELNAMLERGEVISEDFLPKFAAQLSAESKAGLSGAANTAQASINRFNNSLLEFQAAIGTPLLPVQKLGLDVLAGALEILKGVMPIVTVLVGTLGVAIAQTVASMLSGTKVASLFSVAMTGVKASLSATLSLMTSPQFLIVAGIAAATAAFMKFKDVYLDVGKEQRDFSEQTTKGMEAYKQSIIEARLELEKLGKNAPSDLNQLNPENNPQSQEAILQRAQSKQWWQLSNEEMFAMQDNVVQTAQRDRQNEANRQAIQAGVGLGNAEGSPYESLLTLLGSYRGVAGSNMMNPDSTIGQLLSQQKELESLQIQRRSLLPTQTTERENLDRQINSLQEEIAPLQQVLSQSQAQIESQIQFFEQERKRNAEAGNTGEAEKFEAARNKLQSALDELSSYIQPVIDRLGTLNRDLADIQGNFERLNIQIDQRINAEKRTVADMRIMGVTPGQAQFASTQADIAGLSAKASNNNQSVSERLARIESDSYLQELLKPIQDRYGVASFEELSPSQITSQIESMTGEGQQNDKAMLERFVNEFDKITQLRQESDQLITQVAEMRAQAVEQMRGVATSVYEMYRGLSIQGEEFALQSQQIQQQAEAARIQLDTQSQQNKLRSSLTGFADSFLNDFVDNLISMVDQLRKPLEVDNQIEQAMTQAQQQMLQARQQYGDQIRQIYNLNDQLPDRSQLAGLPSSSTPDGSGNIPVITQAPQGGNIGQNNNVTEYAGIQVNNPNPVTQYGTVENQTMGYSPLALVDLADIERQVQEQLKAQGVDVGIANATSSVISQGLTEQLPELAAQLPQLDIPLDNPQAIRQQMEDLRGLSPMDAMNAAENGLSESAQQAYQNYTQNLENIQAQYEIAAEQAQAQIEASSVEIERLIRNMGWGLRNTIRQIQDASRGFSRGIEDLQNEGMSQTAFGQLGGQLRGYDRGAEDQIIQLQRFREQLTATIDQAGASYDEITGMMASGLMPQEEGVQLLSGLTRASGQAQRSLEATTLQMKELSKATAEASQRAIDLFSRQQNIERANARIESMRLQGVTGERNARAMEFGVRAEELGYNTEQSRNELQAMFEQGLIDVEQFENLRENLEGIADLKLDNLRREFESISDNEAFKALFNPPDDQEQQMQQLERFRENLRLANQTGNISDREYRQGMEQYYEGRTFANRDAAGQVRFIDENMGNSEMMRFLQNLGIDNAMGIAMMDEGMSGQGAITEGYRQGIDTSQALLSEAVNSNPVSYTVSEVGSQIGQKIDLVVSRLIDIHSALNPTTRQPSQGQPNSNPGNMALKAANL